MLPPTYVKSLTNAKMTYLSVLKFGNINNSLTVCRFQFRISLQVYNKQQMKARIAKIQPNKFQGNLVCSSSTTQMQLLKACLLIGRGEQLEKQQNCDTYSANHSSISRRHASVTLPYYLLENNKGIIMRSMKNIGGKWVPKYYFELKGIFEKLTTQLLVRIREYCQSKNEIVVKDLNSKYGLYRQINRIELIKQKQKALVNMKINDNEEGIRVICNNDKPIIQMGNQNLQITQIQNNLSWANMQLYIQQIAQKIKQTTFIYENNVRISQNPNLAYYSMLIDNYSQQSKQNHNLYCIVLSKQEGKTSNKISVGRHAQCSIQINKSEISRRQIQVHVNCQGNWVIEDINSTNGTWLKCSKIVYSAQQLKGNQVAKHATHNSYSSCTDLEVQNAQEYNSNNMAYTKCKAIQIKLGEVRLNLQMQGYHEVVQNINYHIHNTQCKQYPQVLTQLYQLSNTKQQYHEQYKQYNIEQNKKQQYNQQYYKQQYIQQHKYKQHKYKQHKYEYEQDWIANQRSRQKYQEQNEDSNCQYNNDDDDDDNNDDRQIQTETISKLKQQSILYLMQLKP